MFNRFTTNFNETGKNRPRQLNISEFSVKIGISTEALRKRIGASKAPPAVTFKSKRTNYYLASDLEKWHADYEQQSTRL